MCIRDSVSSLKDRYSKKLQAGDVLFREGDAGDVMYVIQAGGVRIWREIRQEVKVLAELGPGEFFGEMAILNSKARMANATVTTDTTLLAIDQGTFEAMIKANTEIAVRLIKKLASRLDDANEQIETLLLNDANSRVVHALLSAARALGPDRKPLVVDGAVDMIVNRTGIERPRVEGVLARMERSQLIHRREDDVAVPQVTKLEEFLKFLEMRERFGQSS